MCDKPWTPPNIFISGFLGWGSFKPPKDRYPQVPQQRTASPFLPGALRATPESWLNGSFKLNRRARICSLLLDSCFPCESYGGPPFADDRKQSRTSHVLVHGHQRNCVLSACARAWAPHFAATADLGRCASPQCLSQPPRTPLIWRRLAFSGHSGCFFADPYPGHYLSEALCTS